MSDVVTDRRLDANDGTMRPLRADGRIHELRELVIAVTGRDWREKTNLCAAVEYDLIDCPLLRVEWYAVDEDDQTILIRCNADHGARQRSDPPREPSCTCDVKRYTTEHALTAPLPEWWRPEA